VDNKPINDDDDNDDDDNESATLEDGRHEPEVEVFCCFACQRSDF